MSLNKNYVDSLTNNKFEIYVICYEYGHFSISKTLFPCKIVFQALTLSFYSHWLSRYVSSRQLNVGFSVAFSYCFCCCLVLFMDHSQKHSERIPGRIRFRNHMRYQGSNSGCLLSKPESNSLCYRFSPMFSFWFTLPLSHNWWIWLIGIEWTYWDEEMHYHYFVGFMSYCGD